MRTSGTISHDRKPGGKGKDHHGIEQERAGLRKDEDAARGLWKLPPPC